jgi:hypothetical protein
VVLGNGQRIIAPWSERVRYSAKKNGYHGGASPQEVVIPLGVFVPAGVAVAGWREVATDLPAWWPGEDEQPAPKAKPRRTPGPTSPTKPNEQGQLFAMDGEPAPEAEGETAQGPEWIDRLLASETMAEQRRMASRVALPEERLRAVLAELDERGGKLTRTALATRIGVPALRIGGVISALRRVLNVDGYPVLSVDEASETVALNREQLFRQFGL